MGKKQSGVALVTGANRGIGFELRRQLASRGFVVLLTARHGAEAKAAAMQLAQVGVVKSLLLDVADSNSVKNAANETATKYGYLDVLVNNAGINYDTWETVENADINGTVMQTITTNLLGPWRVCQAFAPAAAKKPSRANRERVIGIGIAGGNGRWSACVSSHQSRSKRVDAHASW